MPVRADCNAVCPDLAGYDILNIQKHKEEMMCIMTNRIVSMLLVLLMTLTMLGTASVSAAELRNPYEAFNADTYDEVVVKRGTVNTANGGLGGIYGGSYSVFKNLNFTTPPTMVSVESAAADDYTGHYFELRLDSLTGKLLGTFEPPNTKGWNTYIENKMVITDDITGVHDLYVIAQKNAACPIRNIVFTRGSENIMRFPMGKKTNTFRDITDPEQLKIADTLTFLGLTSEAEDGLYGCEREFTLDETLTAVSRIRGMDFKEDLKTLEMSDADYFAYLGYSKDNNFDRYVGTDPVSVKDLSGLLLSSLGWLDVIEYLDKDIMALATKEKLLTGLSNTNADAILNKMDASRIIYNALSARFLELDSISENGSSYTIDDQTGIMAVYNDVYKTEGIVEANTLTTLVSPVTSLKENEVTIDGVTYNTGKTSIPSAIGCAVEFYYEYNRKTGIRTILYYDDITEDIVVIPSEDLSAITMNKLEYTVGGKIRTITYDKSGSVIYNGVLAQDYTSVAGLIGNLDTFKGSITVIDNGNDKLLKIDSYKSVVMERFSDESGYLADRYGNHVDMSLNSITGKKTDFAYTSYNDEGGIVDMSIYPAGTVVDVSVSHNTTGNNYVRLIVPENVIYGEIAGIDSDGKVTIGGITYGVCDEYNAAVKKGKAYGFEVGNEGDFYLDSFGNVCAYVSATRDIVGVIRGFEAESSAFNDEVSIKMYTYDGENLTFKFKDNATVDGYKVGKKGSGFASLTDLVKYFKTNYDSLLGTVASYRVDKYNQVYYLDTCLTAADNKFDTMKKIYSSSSPVRVQGGVVSTSGCYTVWDGNVVFGAPIPGSLAFDDDLCYSIKSGPSSEYNYVDCYATDGSDKVCDVMVIRGDYGKWAYDKLLVEKITNILLPDGSITHGVYGWLYGYAKTAQYKKLEFDSITAYKSLVSSNVKPGDIINVKYDLNDRIINCNDTEGLPTGVTTSSVMYTAATDTLGSIGRSHADYGLHYRAEIVDMTDKYIFYETKGSTTLSAASLSGTKVLCFDRASNKASLLSLADLRTREDNGEGTQILVNINNKVADTIVYYEN